MQWIKLTIQPQSGFATPPRGDTLFGQLCWAIREMEGEQVLTALLEGYTAGQPFVVVSDAFPQGCLPRPSLPAHLLGWTDLDARQRKSAKQRQWLPETELAAPLAEWGDKMRTAAELVPESSVPGHRLSQQVVAPHNTINRLTNATGTGQFAPYTARQTWYAPGVSLDIHLVVDEQRVTSDQLRCWWHNMGLFGVGKDATVGMGKFRLQTLQPVDLPHHPEANAGLTLAPSAPQGQAWQPERCYYQTFTRFGRHGAQLAVAGYPYKNPVLMADTGAVLTPRGQPVSARFVGQGLGGQGELSRLLPATVHQGYAPVVPVCLSCQ